MIIDTRRSAVRSTILVVLGTAFLLLNTNQAYAEPKNASWEGIDGWSVTLSNNTCVVKKIFTQYLPALASNQETFGFAFSHSGNYGSLGLYYPSKTPKPPDAIVFVNDNLIIKLDTIVLSEKDDTKSTRGSFHAATDIAPLPFDQVEGVLTSVEKGTNLSVYLATGRYVANISRFAETRHQFGECMSHLTPFDGPFILRP
jgi:hypothetical protein